MLLYLSYNMCHKDDQKLFFFKIEKDMTTRQRIKIEVVQIIDSHPSHLKRKSTHSYPHKANCSFVKTSKDKCLLATIGSIVSMILTLIKINQPFFICCTSNNRELNLEMVYFLMMVNIIR